MRSIDATSLLSVALPFYFCFEYLVPHLFLVLLPVAVLFVIDLVQRRGCSRELKLAVLCLSPLLLGGGISGNTDFAAKLLLHLVVAEHVSSRFQLRFKLMALSFIPAIFASCVLYYFQQLPTYDSTRPYVWIARNHFDYLMASTLLLAGMSGPIVALLLAFTMARWNLIVLMLARFRWVLAILVALAYLKLAFFTNVNTTFGLRPSSDMVRWQLLLQFFEMLRQHPWGLDRLQIQNYLMYRVHLADSFESNYQQLVAMYGGLAIPFLWFLLRRTDSPVRTYLVFISFFNPTLFSLSYFVFYFASLQQDKGRQA